MAAYGIMKNVSDTYLYRKADYGREIYNYLMTATQIDKKSDAFQDVLYNVKMRQTSPVLSKVLMSNKVVLLIGKKDMSRIFRVMREKDPRDLQNGTKKVYIDCTNLIIEKDGVYVCKNIPVLISYLITAMVYVIYYDRPELIIRNNALTTAGTEAFVDLCTYVLGFLKVPISYINNKEKIGYVCAVYYQRCILGKTDSSVNTLAKKVSKITARNADYLDILFDSLYNGEDELNIENFIAKIAQVFLNQSKDYRGNDKFDVDTFIGKWMYMFGPGTVLGLECFVPFTSILTDCYVGAYINNQNTIEKIVARNVAEFTTTLLKIGSENA